LGQSRANEARKGRHVIIKTISHVEIGDDKARCNLHHPDGYVTGIILEPDQPFPISDTTCVIEAGRVVFQLADGSSHTALQHAPALDAFKRSGAALATLVYDRLNGGVRSSTQAPGSPCRQVCRRYPGARAAMVG